MPDERRVPAADLPPGGVRRAGPWAVVNRGGTYSAVSRRCRHQLGDLSKGSLDEDGCLVCPWHGSAFDLGSGEPRRGPAANPQEKLEVRTAAGRVQARVLPRHQM